MTHFLARRIAPYLEETAGIPLFGKVPRLDVEQLGRSLSEKIGSLQIRSRNPRILEKEKILEGLGPNPDITPIFLTPLASPLFWIMPREELNSCISLLLTGKNETNPFSSQALQEGYYRYLWLQVLHVAKDLAPLSSLSLQLGEKEDFPDLTYFCIDVELHMNEGTCLGRLAISLSLKEEWALHFAQLPETPVMLDRARELELSLGVRVGQVELSLDEWQEFQIGDALLLDRASFQKEGKVVTLVLGDLPLFQARLQDNQLTILEYAFYYEESMQPSQSDENEPLEGEDAPKEREDAPALSSIQNYPMTLTVELSRLKMTLEQMMRLSAGNTLELPLDPYQGVALTVNGRLIGRGELIEFDEKIAVRILEMA